MNQYIGQKFTENFFKSEIELACYQVVLMQMDMYERNEIKVIKSCLNKKEVIFVTNLGDPESINHMKWSRPRKSKYSFMAFVFDVLKQTNKQTTH